MEDYAAKMALKTDADLRAYVTGYAQYREAAVLAAFDELRRRGQPAAEESALRPALEIAAQAGAANAEKILPAVPRAPAVALADAEAEQGPPLYSLMLVVMMTLFFSMVSGAALVGLNLGRLRQWLALAGLVAFTVVYLLGSMLLLAGLVEANGLQSGAVQTFALLFNLPALLIFVLWYWPRYFSAARHPGRSWLPPLAVCFLLTYGLTQLGRYAMQRLPPAERQRMEQLLPAPPTAE